MARNRYALVGPGCCAISAAGVVQPVIDIIIVVLALAGTLLNAHMKRTGFIVWFVSNIGLIFANLEMQRYAFAFLYFVYAWLCIYGWITWGKKQNG